MCVCLCERVYRLEDGLHGHRKRDNSTSVAGGRLGWNEGSVNGGLSGRRRRVGGREKGARAGVISSYIGELIAMGPGLSLSDLYL